MMKSAIARMLVAFAASMGLGALPPLRTPGKPAKLWHTPLTFAQRAEIEMWNDNVQTRKVCRHRARMLRKGYAA